MNFNSKTKSVDIINRDVYKDSVKGYIAFKNIGQFSGKHIGWAGSCNGEVACFHSHNFCWDILTDPAFQKKIVITGQRITENRPPQLEEIQSFMPHLSAVVFLGDPDKEKEDLNYGSLSSYLKDHGIAGFVPDRPQFLRDIMKISRPSTAGIGTERESAINLSEEKVKYDINDIKSVSSPHEFYWDLTSNDYPEERKTVVVWDFGANYNLLRCLKLLGCRVRVAPANTLAEQIVGLAPDGVIIAGGPAAARNMKAFIPRVERMIGIRPLLGVACGAALLAGAMGAEISQLPETHFGTAVPVEVIKTKRVYASYQAHSMQINQSSAIKSGADITEINICDGTIESFEFPEYQAGGSFCLPSIESTPEYLCEYVKSLKVLTPPS